MLLLSLDSAASGCGACVWKDGATLALAQESMARGQDARLIPLVQKVMAEAGCSYAELDRVAVTRGPGSFTGLRIGLAAARGIGLAAEKPVVGIDRFSIYRAQNKTESEALLVVLESKRLELYARFYPASGRGEEPFMAAPEELASFSRARPGLAVVGDVALSFGSYRGLAEPEVVTCAALAARADPAQAAFLPRPLYLRAPDVTFPGPEEVCRA